MARLTGYDENRLTRLSFADLSGRDRPLDDRDLVGQLGGEVAPFVTHWIRADGRVLWVRIRSAMTGNAGPAGQHVLCEVEDISSVVDGPMHDDSVRWKVPARAQATPGQGTECLVARADIRDLSAETRDHAARTRDRNLVRSTPGAVSAALQSEESLAQEAIDRLHAARDRDSSARDRAVLLEVIARLS